MNRGAKLAILVAMIFGTLAILVIVVARQQPQSSKPSTLGVATFAPPPRTKDTDCTANGGLQDQACTPGAIIPTATAADICKSGYAKSVRNVPESEKKAVYAEYGIISHASGEYEVDHLISLELGGSNDIANLWPEAAEPTPGFHQKDQIENYLHDQVCAGNMTLAEAQQEIATNWLAVYQPAHK